MKPFEEFEGHLPAGVDEDVIVPNFLQSLRGFENHLVLENLLGDGTEDDGDPLFREVLLQVSEVALLEP